MSQDNMRVMEKLVLQCRQAYYARKPLILVDTEDISLMERLAQESGVVSLFRRREVSYDQKSLRYYQYVGEYPNDLAKAENYTYLVKDLQELAEQGSSMDYGKLPMLLVAHLTQKDSTTEQYLRNYVHAYMRCRDNRTPLRSSCVLLYGDPGLLPKDLVCHTEILTVEYPTQMEIKEILRRLADKERETIQETIDEAIIDDVSECMVGFSLSQVEEYTNRLLWVRDENDQPLIFSENRKEAILDAKAQAIRSTGQLLTLYRDKKKEIAAETMPRNNTAENDLGGMEAYKKWAERAGKHMLDHGGYARNRGVPAMKGVLLCGVPGCGKSEAAKILHRQWGMTMLRLDIDQLMGGLVGDSERNLRQALALAEAMSPCILWIDELEKGFEGAASSQGDGGTFKRMFGRLLTWMQENKKPCFIFATANDISHLPPEFFRSGRFDSLFAVYMPTSQECEEILKEQMRRADKRRKDAAKAFGSPEEPADLFEPKCYAEDGIKTLIRAIMTDQKVTQPKFLSGADIEKAAINALKSITLDKPSDSIDLLSWQEALTAAVQDPQFSTQGSSSGNLDKIAACYVRLMRENFIPVSGEDQCLFRKEHYKCSFEADTVKVSYEGECPLDNAYDQALYDAMKERIERIAGFVEVNALKRICL